jgi:methyl-accepting chemotaxis protein
MFHVGTKPPVQLKTTVGPSDDPLDGALLVPKKELKMDFDKAIQVHVQWKSKLAAYIAKPDHSLSAAAIAKEDCCDLGKWLRSQALKYSNSPEFTKLVTDHARFHVAAADVVRKADAGEHVSDEIALGAHSEYAAASNTVVTELMKMKRVA